MHRPGALARDCLGPPTLRWGFPGPSPLLALPFRSKPLFTYLRSRRHVTPLTRELVVDTLNVRVSRHYCDTLAFLCLPQTFLSPVAHIANVCIAPKYFSSSSYVTVDTSILTQQMKSGRGPGEPTGSFTIFQRRFFAPLQSPQLRRLAAREDGTRDGWHRAKQYPGTESRLADLPCHLFTSSREWVASG